MKVWVPIDLPEGARVRDIIVEVGPGGPAHTRVLEPLGPAVPGYAARSAVQEPQSVRWEYEAVVQHMFIPVVAEAHGQQGWELVGPMGDGRVWFKRRLA